MADLDLDDLLAVPGRVVWNPTEAPSAGTFPFGGTAFGHLVDFYFRTIQTVRKIREETLGTTPVEGFYKGVEVIAGFVMRQFDEDALQLVMPGFTTVNNRTVFVPNRAIGTLASSYMGKILFVPEDTNRFYVLLRNMIPELEETSRVMHDRQDEQEFACLFSGLVDEAGTLQYSWGRKEDLTTV